jgi:hypothetical protein
MRLKISSQSLGAVAPYVVSAVLLLPPVTATARAADEAHAEARIFVDISEQIKPQSRTTSSIYTWELDRPELAPSLLVKMSDDATFEEYEPFIASDGWRDVRDARGPFVVEEDQKPVAFFDEYDLSAIALYGQQQ